MTDDATDTTLYDHLQTMVGNTGSPSTARDPVSENAIRTWCDAMSEPNPYFTDPAAAAAGPHGSIVAPPATLNMWNMPGLIMGEQKVRSADEPASAAYSALDDAGYTGVVAVNSNQVYHRYLRPGDLVTGQNKLVEVSVEKTTALGIGYFVTTETEYTDQHGEHIGSLFFRILKFRPGTGRKRPETDPKRAALIEAGLDPDELLPVAERPKRPRPSFNQDQAWHWEGLRKRELRIQRFTDDGSLVHPPSNANPKTQSMDWDYVVASGRGTLYSWTVPHYPQVPAFDYPLVVGLIELEEGVRIVSNVVGVPPDQLTVGMPLEITWLDTHDDVSIHQFMPATTPLRSTTLTAAEVAVGDPLPLKSIPLTPRLIVSAALATRDYQDVHHDRDAAHSKGSKDIFMNILTTTGLTNAWLGEWAGPDAIFKNVTIGLGAPNYPYDLMTFSGQVTEVSGNSVTVGYKGANSLGNHVSGTAEIELPGNSAKESA